MRRGGFFYAEWPGPGGRDFDLTALLVRFVVNVGALWLAQFLVTGFDINTAGALVFGAIVFGLINAFIRPFVALISFPLTCLTLGFFTLIINTAMLGLTAWTAGTFDVAFHVDGFIAAFLGALIISIVSAILSRWADRNVLSGM